MSWIDQLIRHLEQVSCSGCGEYYRGGDIAAVVTEPSRLIVRLRCRWKRSPLPEATQAGRDQAEIDRPALGEQHHVAPERD